MDEQENIIRRKIAWILGETETRVEMDMSLQQIILGLLEKYEQLAEEKEVILYER